MEWIKCTTRLPVKTGKYLALFDFREIEALRFYTETNAWNCFSEESRENELKNITHWMELPPMPEDVETKQGGDKI